MQQHPSLTAVFGDFDGEEDFTAFRKFDRIPNQVHQDLSQAVRVAYKLIGNPVGNLACQFDVFLSSSRGQHFESVVQGIAKPEGRRMKVELARFDLRDIKNVVDDLQQGVG